MHLEVHTTIISGLVLDFMGCDMNVYSCMKKIIFLSLLYLYSPLLCISQTVQKYEFEASFGFTYPLFNYFNGEKLMGPCLGIELRRNIFCGKWDYGVGISTSTSVYRFKDSESDWYWDQSNRLINILVLSDYNFNQGKKINPFAGVEIGVGSFESINEVKYPTSGASFIFIPRIGVEFFHHIRLTLFSSLSRIGYNNWGISLGAVLGGRPKKLTESF